MFDNRKPHVIVLRLAAVLLILVTLSTSMIAGRYARYTTTASASDTARVAKFEVHESSDLLTDNVAIRIIPGSTAQNFVEITNNSEVAVCCTITAENPYKVFPLAFTLYNVEVVGDTTNLIPFDGNIAPGAEAKYAVVTSWTGTTDSSYSGKVDLIRISGTTTQSD